MSKEFQVTLSLPVEATNIPDAIEEFRNGARFGADYVYTVDTGDALYSYDTETSTRTEVKRIDMSTLDELAVKVYGIAHEADDDEAVQTDWDRRNVTLIAQELYQILGMI